MNAKQETSSAQNAGKQDARTKAGASANADANAIALLKADHRKVNALFRSFKAEESAERKVQLVREICTELIVHTQLEEEIFYAACREADVEDDLLDEAQVEHDGAKVLIAELLQEQPDAAFYDAKVSVLSEYIKHHVGEEENAGSGIFAKARAAKLDMNALGQRLQSRKEELMQEIQSQGLRPPTLRALDVGPINRSKQETSTMARQNDRDRDEQGRFSGNNDDQRGGGRGYYGRSNEGRWNEGRSNDRGRDDQGRFMSDDDRSGGRYERDQDEAYRSYSRGGESRSRSGGDYDDDRYSRGFQGGGSQGRGYEARGFEGRESEGRGRGWFGDSEGHSRDSEEGWESRGRGDSASRSWDDEDDRYSSRGFQGSSRDSQGASRDEEFRGGSSSRGEGRGWFGDSDGHSRASEEGWENRARGGSASRSRDDDDRGQRGGSSRGRGQEGQGHGGWFGDSRGHSEASRRGWQNR